MSLQQWAQAIGLVGGPVLALVAYFALPVESADAAGRAVPLGQAPRATLAMMVWLVTALTYFLIGPLLLAGG
jgi:hypothetical protein